MESSPDRAWKMTDTDTRTDKVMRKGEVFAANIQNITNKTNSIP